MTPQAAVPRLRTRTGALLPILGLGTWRMGEDPRRRAVEVEALRYGIGLGMTLVDTAEMYGDGGAERVVAEAIAGRRERIYLVSKVLPHNASRAGTVRAAERSLRRLGTDRMDLYLLHWPGSHPLEETLAAFDRLRSAGKVLDYGVSNFDLHEVQEAERHALGRTVAANQVLYNLRRRGVERRLLPWCREHGVALMAYSPLEQGRLGGDRMLQEVARRHGASPARVALAWLLRREGVVTVVKAANPEHLRDNVAALSLALSHEDMADLAAAFPAPATDGPLETL